MTHKEKITEYINSSEYFPMTADDMAVILCVPKSAADEFSDILSGLEAEGIIVKGKKGRYFSSEKLGFVRGIFRASVKGFGFVTADSEEDIYIPDNYVGGALSGDTVLVKIKKKSISGGKRREGEIVRVLTRADRIVVGVFEQERGYGIVYPDDNSLPEMFVDPHDINGAINGQKVVCKITQYETAITSLCCKVTEILGFPYDFGVDVLSVIKSCGFSTEFSEAVMRETDNISEISDNELKSRLDLTANTVITIDGEDTKDIDDAVSIEKTESGYTLGVHIADVSHYVKPKSATDKEAFSRGTSVYLADRVIPMLPVKLSNGLCSLNEGQLRLTMSVFIDYDNNANVVNTHFYKSFIKSAARMTYTDVYNILENHPKALCERYGNIVPTLENMYELAQKLNKKTKERGAIDFNIPEAKAVFDKNGKTVDIVLRKTSFANNIIEEFMIAANSAVAKKLSDANTGAIYRIHESPNEERFANAALFMYNSGYGKLNSIQKMMQAVKGTPQEAVVSALLLRSMAKARYSEENSGHFGLKLDYYCHFTSPIRRYPDLCCHRALKAVIESDEKAKKALSLFVVDASAQCSEREQAAAKCERDTLDIKKAEYMESFVGQEFEGVISSVTNFGFFVMLPNTVEGLVRAETLRDDYYVFDEKTLTLIGERTKNCFTIGNPVKVKLTSASEISRRIDFELIQGGKKIAGKRIKKNTGSKQNRASRVFHRRKARSRH